MKVTAPRRQTLPSGIYSGEVAGIEERAGEDGSFLLWRFDVLVDGRHITVSATSSQRFGPKAKLRRWTEALLGRTIQAGEELDLDDLIGRRCRLVLEVVERDGERFNNVTALSSTEPPADDEPTNRLAS